MAKKYEWAALLTILAVAVFFRFYLITEIPPGLYPDEATNGNNAVEALRTGEFKLFFPENNGREGLFINIQALSLYLFGAEPWALRAVSAVFGVLAVLGVYLLTKELFWGARSSSLAALLASFFIATSYWHINFSRISFRAIMVPFLATFAFYWLIKALRTEKVSSAVFSGIATGLGFHTYIAFRFVPFAMGVPILLASWNWFRGRRVQRCVPCVAALVVFGALVAALPLGYYFLQHPQDFFGRGGQVSIFSGESPIYEFVKSNVLTLGMFNVSGDCNQRHNLSCEPQLFFPVGILFLIGAALILRDAFRRPVTENIAPWALLSWFAFLMLPATLTREGLPHALRAIGLIPPVMVIAGFGGAKLWYWIKDYLVRAAEDPRYRDRQAQLHRITREVALVGLLILLWIPLDTFKDYFIRFGQAPRTQDAFAADMWRAGRYLQSQPDDIKKFIIVNLHGDDIRGVGAPAQTVMFATDTFDTGNRSAKNFTYVRNVEEISFRPDDRVIIYPLNGFDRTAKQAILEKFPQLKPEIPGDFLLFVN